MYITQCHESMLKKVYRIRYIEHSLIVIHILEKIEYWDVWYKGSFKKNNLLILLIMSLLSYE